MLDTSCRHHRLVVAGKPALSHVSAGWTMDMVTNIMDMGMDMATMDIVTNIFISYSSSSPVHGGIVRGVPI